MIIGIDGIAGAGKDTAADALVGRGFTKVSFADALRKSASLAFGIHLSDFLDRDIKDNLFEVDFELTNLDLASFCTILGFRDKATEVITKFAGTKVKSPRQLLQFVGTEIGRETLSQSIWLDKYLESIQGLSLVVTPDCRFSNERELVKKLNGKLFYIQKDDLVSTENHKSGNDKWSLDKYDVVVYNNSTAAAMQEDIRLWWSMRGR